MCLYLRENHPRIAKEDITVLKYTTMWGNEIISPFQHMTIPINEVLTAFPDKVDIISYGKDVLGNDVYSLNGGAIHAKLIKGGMPGCECRKAIIPSGTEYWVSMRGDEIAARSMIITNVEWDKGDNRVSESIFEEILENSPELNGLRIGDYLLENGGFTRPRKGLTEDEVVGIVSGFHEGEPIIAALTFFDGAFEKLSNSQFGHFYPCDYNDDVIKRFNGRRITEGYRATRMGKRNDRFESFEACVNYRKDNGDEWYFGTAGEVATMLDNCIYLNAAHHITELGFLIGNEWYNSCSENSSEYSWDCCFPCNRVSCFFGYKDYSRRTVPFLSL